MIPSRNTFPSSRGGGWFDGCGGVVSTASDLARFLQMLVNRGQLDGVRMLRPETVALMTKDHIGDIRERGFEVSGYGLGCGVRSEGGETRAILWSGGPYNTFFTADLKNGMIGIFLMQTEPFMHLGLIPRFAEASMACVAEEAPAPGKAVEK
jgi:CubicO group peptidase (beta-lactamase class C family)